MGNPNFTFSPLCDIGLKKCVRANPAIVTGRCVGGRSGLAPLRGAGRVRPLIPGYRSCLRCAATRQGAQPPAASCHPFGLTCGTLRVGARAGFQRLAGELPALLTLLRVTDRRSETVRPVQPPEPRAATADRHTHRRRKGQRAGTRLQKRANAGAALRQASGRQNRDWSKSNRNHGRPVARRRGRRWGRGARSHRRPRSSCCGWRIGFCPTAR